MKDSLRSSFCGAQRLLRRAFPRRRYRAEPYRLRALYGGECRASRRLVESAAAPEGIRPLLQAYVAAVVCYEPYLGYMAIEPVAPTGV